MMPSCEDAVPDNIGSHDPDRMCHSTGIDVAPNVTAHRAMPYTCIGSLLYGLILVFEGIILSNNFHAFACLVPHTLTLAPVSAITVPKLLLMITSKFLFSYERPALVGAVYWIS